MNTSVSPESFGDMAIRPGKAAVLKAPGESEWQDLQDLLTFAKTLERKNRETMLLLGAVFSDLKRLYRNYAQALYKSGFRKDEIASYNQFKAESGFIIPSQGSISNYTRVYACYVVSYQMATLERSGAELSFSWIDPKLLAAPFEMLVYLIKENYHNSAARAYTILNNLQVMKRSDFWLWLERQERVTPLPPPADLVDVAAPSDTPYQNSTEAVFEPYEIAAPDFDWNPLMKRVEIPKTLKRPIRITVQFHEIEYGKPNPVDSKTE